MNGNKKPRRNDEVFNLLLNLWLLNRSNVGDDCVDLVIVQRGVAAYRRHVHARSVRRVATWSTCLEEIRKISVLMRNQVRGEARIVLLALHFVRHCLSSERRDFVKKANPHTGYFGETGGR